MVFGGSRSVGHGSGGNGSATGGRDGENTGGGGGGVGPFRHHQMMPPPLPLHLLPTVPISSAAAVGVGLGGDDEFPRRDERVPQWSNQETRDFIAIRAEMERDFASAKRSNSKSLWEVVAAKMKDLGHRRTSDQCKCKWKNLINRCKGKEASDPNSGKQCQFFEELSPLFTTKDNIIQQLQFEPDLVPQHVRKRARSTDQSSEEFSEDADEYASADDDDAYVVDTGPKKKAPKRKPVEKSLKHQANVKGNHGTLESIRDILGSFIQQQLRIEMQWMESMEKRAEERELFQREWRETMEKLEKERIMFEQARREREEQRKMREESRAEKRDALLTSLLKKLINE